MEIRQQKTSKTVKITESEQIFLNVISYGVGIITAIIALLAYTIVDLMGGEYFEGRCHMKVALIIVVILVFYGILQYPVKMILRHLFHIEEIGDIDVDEFSLCFNIVLPLLEYADPFISFPHWLGVLILCSDSAICIVVSIYIAQIAAFIGPILYTIMTIIFLCNFLVLLYLGFAGGFRTNVVVKK